MSEVRAGALMLFVALTAIGCRFPDADAPSSPAPTRRAVASVAPRTTAVPPLLQDKNCSDFATANAAQEFFIEAGGPDQDLHTLDPDHNGQACDESTSPSPAAPVPAGGGAPVVVQRPQTPPPTSASGPGHESTTVSGDVEEGDGGSAHHHSCDSPDPASCPGD
jgi:hypothetical protein